MDSVASVEYKSCKAGERDWLDWRRYLPGAVCLFCPATYPSSGSDVDELFEHMKSAHNFDFTRTKDDLNLSFYQQVKLINYIRRQVHLNACIFCDEKVEDVSNECLNGALVFKHALLQHMQKEGHMKLPEDRSEWDQSQYFFPTYENDTLLSCLQDAGMQSLKVTI